MYMILACGRIRNWFNLTIATNTDSGHVYGTPKPLYYHVFILYHLLSPFYGTGLSLCYVRFSLYDARSHLYDLRLSLYHVKTILYDVQLTLYDVLLTLYNVQMSLNNV